MVRWKLARAPVASWAGLIADHRRRHICPLHLVHEVLDPPTAPVGDGAGQRRYRRGARQGAPLQPGSLGRTRRAGQPPSHQGPRWHSRTVRPDRRHLGRRVDPPFHAAPRAGSRQLTVGLSALAISPRGLARDQLNSVPDSCCGSLIRMLSLSPSIERARFCANQSVHASQLIKGRLTAQDTENVDQLVSVLKPF